MPIFIKEINVQNLGPHRQFSLQLGRFNLVYGHNENGKTYLVEFIVRSLFKQTKQWHLRKQQGKGKVTVQGLNDGGLVEFSPSSARKLEDFWDEANAGLPPDFSRLLVVKGAQVDIARVEGGVDKTILKRLLSNKEILDNIQKRISKTIQESEVQNGVISGPKRGEISSRQELEAQLKSIDNLFAQIDKEYSGGRRKALAEKKQNLRQQQKQMLKAKQFLAFKIDREVRSLKAEKDRISMAKVLEVRNELAQYRKKVTEYRQKQHVQKEAEFKSQHYDWLKSAHNVYQNSLSQQVEEPPWYLLILTIIMIVGAGVLAFLNLPLFAVIALTCALGSGLFYVKRYHTLLSRAMENQEIDNLKKTFYRNFEKQLTGLPVILEYLQKLEEDYNTARLLSKQLADDFEQLHALKLKIAEQIQDLAGEKTEPKFWDEVLRTLESEARNLENQLHEKELYQAQLSVDVSDYVKKDPGIEYSQQESDELENKLRETQTLIDEETQKLTSLKQMLCHLTSDDISTSWETIIANLRDKREKTSEMFKEKTAEILGKIAVYKVLKELRKDEDTKIIAGLESDSVQQPLYQLTGRYKNVSLEGERLVVSDTYHNFELSELSTGAQEQVLLALRIGFSAQLVRGDSLFLILDDAFQYSDWQRRKLLVDKVTELARTGWQIIYFSMDDNIRLLFEKNGRLFGDDYKFIDLNKKTPTETLDLF